MSVIVGRKRFNFSKYGCVLLLVIGVTLFLYKPAKEETSTVRLFIIDYWKLFSNLYIKGLFLIIYNLILKSLRGRT